MKTLTLERANAHSHHLATIGERIRQIARSRIQNGETTERRLAKDSLWSQPHMHKVLAGKRAINIDVADSLIVTLHIEPCEIWTPAELELWQPARSRPAIAA